MFRKTAMVVLGTVMLVTTSGAVHAQTNDPAAATTQAPDAMASPPTDATAASAAKDAAMQQAIERETQEDQASCASNDGWWDPAAGVCTEPSF